ncbi:MAG: hypothetical protein ACRDK9_09240 [Solirubrobacterales bacterium]
MEQRPRVGGIGLDERTLRIAVIALGAFHLLEGGWQLLAPGSFFDEIGRYGVENTHYVGDVGAFTAGYGLALVLAAGRPSWWAPLLAVGALWYGLHALNHLFDIGEARSDARGAVDTILLAIGAGLLAWLAVTAERLRSAGPS